MQRFKAAESAVQTKNWDISRQFEIIPNQEQMAASSTETAAAAKLMMKDLALQGAMGKRSRSEGG